MVETKTEHRRTILVEKCFVNGNLKETEREVTQC